MSHAIELLLKCALLKRGQSTEDLKKYPIRHSMELLAKQLTNHGVHLSEGSLGIIRDLSRQHEKHVLRYTAMLDDGEITFTPDPEALFEVLDELLMAGRICP